MSNLRKLDTTQAVLAWARQVLRLSDTSTQMWEPGPTDDSIADYIAGAVRLRQEWERLQPSLHYCPDRDHRFMEKEEMTMLNDAMSGDKP